jgi:hypothetical protein
MMCCNSEWREREGAEAIFTASGIFALVRIHSIEEKSGGMEFCVDKIPWPGLPVSPGWRVRDSFSFHFGGSWDSLSIGRDRWAGSPYAGWILIFNAEAIETFKAIALQSRNELEGGRWKRLRECLIAWYKRQLAL